MLKKILVLICMIALSCGTPGNVQAAQQDDLRQINPAQLWPDKSSWIGQQAIFFRAKMHRNVSYLFIYENAGTHPSGIDQLELGKRIANKAFVIKALYQLQTPESTEYYWQLVDSSGTQTVWVKDTKEKQPSDQPFALTAELDKEKQMILQAASFSNLTVWNNSNMINQSEIGGTPDHLEMLTVVDFRSDGPFSEKYMLTLKRKDGSPLIWKTGFQAASPVYSNSQFCETFQKNFYLKNPVDAHPNWPDTIWSAIQLRKVAVGWDKDMVLMSWGKPEQIVKGDGKGDGKGGKGGKGKADYESWNYKDNRHLLFQGNQLAKIRVPRPPVKTEVKNQQNTPKNQDDGLEDVTEAFVK